MLELVDLDIEQLGYRKFISSWVYQGEGGSFLVDPGPACTLDKLYGALDKLGVQTVDWIFLTHIHLDHAGGIGHVTERFDTARVVCHQKAVSHLVDPERLWEGSVKVLGDVAGIYGRMEPVPADRIVVTGHVDFESGVEVLDAPGHAAHHQCFAFNDLFFAGELFGIFQDLGDAVYLRPATPPRFILEEYIASLDRMAPHVDRKICFAHYGAYHNGAEILQMAKNQLRLWVDVVKGHVQRRGEPDMEAIIADLIAEDAVYARINALPEDIYKRERYYTVNTIRGILDYIRNNV